MRVRCANCGMVYERVPVSKEIPDLGTLNCPKCGSNAFYPIPGHKYTKYVGGQDEG